MRVRSGSKFLVVIPIPHPPCSTSRLRASVSGSFYCSPWVEGICSSWTGDGYHFQSLSFDGINLTWDFPCWLIVKLCHLVLVLRGYENWSSITQDKWIRTNYRYMQYHGWVSKHYAKWRMLNAKGHILCDDSTYTGTGIRSVWFPIAFRIKFKFMKSLIRPVCFSNPLLWPPQSCQAPLAFSTFLLIPSPSCHRAFAWAVALACDALCQTYTSLILRHLSNLCLKSHPPKHLPRPPNLQLLHHHLHSLLPPFDIFHVS